MQDEFLRCMRESVQDALDLAQHAVAAVGMRIFLFVRVFCMIKLQAVQSVQRGTVVNDFTMGVGDVAVCSEAQWCLISLSLIV